MNRILRLSAVLLASVWLSGCSITPVRDNVSVNVPARWSNVPAAENEVTTQVLAHWWRDFNDPLLDDLVEKALAANHDLKIAAERVREARAFATVAESVLYPTIDAGAKVGRNKSFERIPKPTIGQTGAIGFEAAWEIDLFGGNRFAAAATLAQARALEEARHAVQVGLLAQVATSYLELRGSQKQTAILKENIALQRVQLELLEARYRAGLATELDIARQQELLHASEGALPLLANVTATLIHRLSVLLGEPPANLETKLGPPAPLPLALPKIPGLLPSELFAQRPDIRQAQAEVVAAAAKLGSAKMDLFPKFFLSASASRSTLELNPLPAATGNVFALGFAITEPLFNAGRIRANIEAANSRLSQVADSYEKTFLIALEEVENAFVAHTSARERRNQLTQAAEAAARAERLVQEFYKRGITDFLAVLDAQRVKLKAEDDQIRADTAVSVSMVSLYRAFGGGWAEEGDTSIPAH